MSNVASATAHTAAPPTAAPTIAPVGVKDLDAGEDILEEGIEDELEVDVVDVDDMSSISAV